jgi:hypothetical protein
MAVRRIVAHDHGHAIAITRAMIALPPHDGQKGSIMPGWNSVRRNAGERRSIW